MEQKKPLSPEQFKEVYSKVPRLCIDLVIRKTDGIVMTLRNLGSWFNMWHLPGATLYYEETIEQAAHRIASEEVGVKIALSRTLGYIEYPSEVKERGFGWTVSIPLLCDWVSGQFKVNNEASKVKIFTNLPLPKNIVAEQKLFLTQHWAEIVPGLQKPK